MLAADSPAQWTAIGSPGTRFQHESVLDEATHRLVIFGGWGDPASPSAPPLVMACALGTAPDWAALGDGSAESPRGRFGAAVAVDPVHHALLVFGGQATDGTGDMLADAWSLSLEPGGTWSRLSPTGPAPSARRFASLFHDAAHGRILLAGGHDSQFLSEFWELRLDPTPVWRPLAFSNDVGANLGAVLDDPVRGDAWSVAWQNEIHRLTIGIDTVTAGPAIALEPGGPWGAPTLLLAGFDPIERRLLWFGYQSGGPTYARLDEGWWFALDEPRTLEPLSIEGGHPANRHLFASTWDADGRRLCVSGGYDDDVTYFGDAWQLAAPPSLPTAVVASLRAAESDEQGVRLAWQVTGSHGEAAVVERSSDGVEWTGAGDARASASDELAWDGPALATDARAAFRLVIAPGSNETRTAAVWVSGPVGAALALAPLASPAGRELAVRLSVRAGEPATLRVLDAAGRVIARASVPSSARNWSFGSPASPGLYFAELTQGSERRVAKLVTLR